MDAMLFKLWESSHFVITLAFLLILTVFDPDSRLKLCRNGCLRNGLAQYVAPISLAHGPGIHSFAGRPSLLLSWSLKKEKTSTNL